MPHAAHTWHTAHAAHSWHSTHSLHHLDGLLLLGGLQELLALRIVWIFFTTNFVLFNCIFELALGLESHGFPLIAFGPIRGEIDALLGICLSFFVIFELIVGS